MIDLSLNITFFITALICNFLVLKFGLRFVRKNKIQIQNIHIGNISRLGGIVIFLHFYLYVFFYDKSFIYFCLIGNLFILPALFEDLNYSIKPSIRLLFILIGSLLLVMELDQLPQFEFIFNSFLNNNIFKILFFSICLATVVNGHNIIDGTNGLSGMTSIVIFGSILYLGLVVGDYQIISLSILIINLLVCFLIFNYPFGKIFLGDSGSYFLGLLAGYLTIYVFGKYPELPTWSAVVILYYPCQEVIFSYFRKIYDKKSPFAADNKHLHLKVFFLLQSNKKPSKLYNALVAPFLSILWLSPLALISFSIQNHILSILAVILLGFIYIFIYYSIPNPESKVRE